MKTAGAVLPQTLWTCLLLGCLAVCSGAPARAQGANIPPQDPAGRDPRWGILVAGISGDPELQKQYVKELADLRGILERELGFTPSQVLVLADDPALDPARIRYQSTRANLESVCRDIAGRAARDSLVFVYLQGHGDSDGKTYRLNLVGPDPTAEDLAAMISAIPAQRTIIVNATNCSGGSLEALAGKSRIVVSATKSGNEKNLTHLGRFFIDALAGNQADVDKNGRVSVFEAFTYAARKVQEYYTREGSLQTEHPVMSDNGDEQRLTLEDNAIKSSQLSRTSYLDRGSPLLAGDGSPEGQALAREAQSLEKQVELLKLAKDEMTEDVYLQRLETLLLKLAEVQAKLRKK